MQERAVGRRERKKAATREAIRDAALELFFDRGFDAVSVREVAERADVSPTTVFAHFPQKESLAFSDEDERHERLVAAVRDRAPGTTVSHALRAHYLAETAELASEPYGRVLALMVETPSLVDYAERMWLRHEGALVEQITTESGLPEPTDSIRLYVRFALQIPLLASRSADPRAAIDAGFQLLDDGARAVAVDSGRRSGQGR
ncbi:TetR/AcrR family transcriptional regulator [Cellulomonas chitinilytica]|uniref:TetR/AcrR family transcriptional regulator n=1 Tax=Cellulomonas chitinilytica TaxID=398759 RepID=UPI000A541037|nr:TetR/AcrR family transcriptional regulator [Cellulomonas chitinilytica]